MGEVKKAIIPVAGLGSSLFPYTKHMSKLMLPIINKPVIHYHIDECINAGIKEVIISGRNLNDIHNYFKEEPEIEYMASLFGSKGSLQKLKSIHEPIKITYVNQKHPKGWLYEIYYNRKRLKNEPYAVLFSDIIYCPYSHKKNLVLKKMVEIFKKTKKTVHLNGRFILKPETIDIIKKLDFKENADSNKKIQKKFYSSIRDKNKNKKKNKPPFTFDNKERKFTGFNFLSYNIKDNYKATACDIGDPLSYLTTCSYFIFKNKNIKKELKKEYTDRLKKMISKTK